MSEGQSSKIMLAFRKFSHRGGDRDDQSVLVCELHDCYADGDAASREHDARNFNEVVARVEAV